MYVSAGSSGGQRHRNLPELGDAVIVSFTRPTWVLRTKPRPSARGESRLLTAEPSLWPIENAQVGTRTSSVLGTSFYCLITSSASGLHVARAGFELELLGLLLLFVECSNYGFYAALY